MSKEKTIQQQQWTTESPTESGWYWVITRENYRMIGEVEIKNKTIQLTGDDELCDFEEILYWLGPLPVPDPPEK